MNLDMNINLLNAYNLPIIDSIMQLSEHTHLSPKLIFQLSKNNYYYYKEFTLITKGKKRTINAPKNSMKIIQLWILREILEKIELSDIAFGFRIGSDYGIKANACIHIDKTNIIKCDVENFFGSIKREKVFYMFNEWGYSMPISNILADLCTVREVLPQGAPTSPYISNIVMKIFDGELKTYCDNMNISVSRYADDITISSNKKTDLLKAKEEIIEKLSKEHLILNDKKTKILNDSNRKVITGIVINSGKPHIKRELKYKIRAMVYKNIFEYGELSEQTKGYIAFVKSVDEERYKYFQKYIEQCIKNKGKND